jgi:hypothetical protein
VPNTPRLGWPYPAENQDPWYEPFQDLVNAMDASAFAVTEDRNIFLMSTATFTWDVGSETLTWDAEIELSSPISGFRHTIDAGSQVIADGGMFYVEVTRNLTNNLTIAGATSSSQPPGVDYESFYALCIRRGTRLYFRNGSFLDDGAARSIFGGSATGASYDDTGFVTLGPAATVQAALDYLKSWYRTAFNVEDVTSSAAQVALGNGTRYWPLVEGAVDTLKFQVRVGLGGPYALRFSYYMATSHAGNVSLRVDRRAFVDGSDPTVGLTAGVGFTVTPGSDTNLHMVTEVDSTSCLTGNLTEGSLVTFLVTRVNDGSDTHTGDMRVLGITLVPHTDVLI